jgi:hypothetical protein
MVTDDVIRLDDAAYGCSVGFARRRHTEKHRRRVVRDGRNDLREDGPTAPSVRRVVSTLLTAAGHRHVAGSRFAVTRG